MYTLGIETSTTHASVALVCKGKSLFSTVFARSFGHSEKIVLAIHDLIKKAKIEPKDLKTIAVGLGPGSYTGLRVGLATAKGLAQFNKTPVVGIASIDAIVQQAFEQWPEKSKTVYGVIDAKRGEFYIGTYLKKGKGFQRKGKIKLISEKDLDVLKEKGAVVWGPEINGVYPSAEGVACLAANTTYKDKIKSKLEPIYLRPFIAKKTEEQKSACFTAAGQKSV